MKLTTLLRLLPAAALASPAAAAVFSWNSGFASGGVVPDGNPTGWSDTRTLSGIVDPQVNDVNVLVTISGGWNGDLYAYLQHASGISILLNRPGITAADSFGFEGAGMSVGFDDNGVNGDSHLTLTGAGIFSGGLWEPDGRTESPLTVLDTSARTSLLSVFNGSDPNGDWTLFVADLSDGGEATVTGWGLQINHVEDAGAVPEPAALTGLAALLGAAGTLRSRRPARPAASGEL